MMHSVFCVVPFIEVACKELFNIQQHSKEKNQAPVSDHSQQCFGFMLHFNHNFYSISVNYSTLLSLH